MQQHLYSIIPTDRADVSALRTLNGRQIILKRGDRLFEQNQQADALYLIQEGWIKTSIPQASGNACITGFSGSEEIIGLSGWHSGSYEEEATAVTRVRLCILPLIQLRQSAELQSVISHTLADNLMKTQGRLCRILNRDAKSRVACFLLELSAERQNSPEITVPFTRYDIASYLGMAFETLSRTLMHFQNSHCIRIHKQKIQLLDINALHAMTQ